jgi:hypothetical protein
MESPGSYRPIGSGTDGQTHWEIGVVGQTWTEGRFEVWHRDPATYERTDLIERIEFRSFDRSLDVREVRFKRLPILLGTAPPEAAFVVVVSDPPRPKCVATKKLEWDDRRIWVTLYGRLRLRRLRALDGNGDVIAETEQ